MGEVGAAGEGSASAENAVCFVAKLDGQFVTPMISSLISASLLKKLSDAETKLGRVKYDRTSRISIASHSAGTRV